MRRDLLQFFYLASAILFVMGLRGLSHPRTARRGMFLAELGMLLAIIGSLLHHEIIDYRFIAAGLVLGTLIGAPMAIWIPMTAVPQRTALSHSFGALAAALIGISEYYRHGAGGRDRPRSDARIADIHRKPDGRGQAAGSHPRISDHLARPELLQSFHP